MGRIEKMEDTAKEIVDLLADKKCMVEEASHILRRAQCIIGEQTAVSRTNPLSKEANNMETKKAPQDISGIKERNDDEKLELKIEMQLSANSVAKTVNLISKKIKNRNIEA